MSYLREDFELFSTYYKHNLKHCEILISNINGYVGNEAIDSRQCAECFGRQSSTLNLITLVIDLVCNDNHDINHFYFVFGYGGNTDLGQMKRKGAKV